MAANLEAAEVLLPSAFRGIASWSAAARRRFAFPDWLATKNLLMLSGVFRVDREIVKDLDPFRWEPQHGFKEGPVRFALEPSCGAPTLISFAVTVCRWLIRVRRVCAFLSVVLMK